MVVVRLARGGTKKRPFYHVVVANSRCPRDGRYLERLGTYNPVATGAEVQIRLLEARINHWIAQGAQCSPRVSRLLKLNKGAQTAA